MPGLIPQEQLDAATPEQLAELAAACLERFEPGFLPGPIFEQVARLSVLSTVEVFAIDTEDPTNPGVLYTRRPETDKWWPGQLHIPGSALLASDEPQDVHDFSEPIMRVFEKELHNSLRRRGPLIPFDIQRRKGPRGKELTPFFWTEVELVPGAQLPDDARFFKAAELEEDTPQNIFIDTHAISGLMAIAAYRNSLQE